MKTLFLLLCSVALLGSCDNYDANNPEHNGAAGSENATQTEGFSTAPANSTVTDNNSMTSNGGDSTRPGTETLTNDSVK